MFFNSNVSISPFRTYIGKPIEYDESLTSDELKDLVTFLHYIKLDFTDTSIENFLDKIKN